MTVTDFFNRARASASWRLTSLTPPAPAMELYSRVSIHIFFMFWAELFLVIAV